MKHLRFEINDNRLFQKKLLFYFKEYKNIAFLNSNNNQSNFFAISNSDKAIDGNWKFGFISYDYKNEIENLTSNNIDEIEFSNRHFFSPELLFEIGRDVVEIFCYTNQSEKNIKEIIANVINLKLPEKNNTPVQVKSRITKQEYLEKVNQLKKHIQLGDVYEINFCQEFYAEEVKIDPVELYIKLNEKSPTPFSSFVKQDDKYLLCASPERFIQKKANKIISQPIKGTIRRGKDKKEDEALKKRLLNDPKERSENVMIVDLVRNDLAKVAKKGTVKVDELFGIYTFPQVHQMISTVSALTEKNTSFDSIVNATFPMGSMTGAPKIRAMELIEQYENTKRGIYSGTVGYIKENGDFDFNVVIRSIMYNQKNKYLSFIVGGAITSQSIPENEYEECLLKAKAIIKTLDKERAQ